MTKKINNNSVSKVKQKQKVKQDKIAKEEQKSIEIESIELFQQALENLKSEHNIKQIKEFSPLAVGVIARDLGKLDILEDMDEIEPIAKKIVKYYNKYFTPELDVDNYMSFITASDMLNIALNIVIQKAEHNKKK